MDNERLTPEFHKRYNQWYNRIYTRIEIAHPELSDSEIVTAIGEEQILTPPMYNGPRQKETHAFGPQKTIHVFKYITQAEEPIRQTMRTFDSISAGAQVYLRARGEKWRYVVEHIWMVLFKTNGEPGDIQVNEDNILSVKSSGVEMWVDPQNVLRTIREKMNYREGQE